MTSLRSQRLGGELLRAFESGLFPKFFILQHGLAISAASGKKWDKPAVTALNPMGRHPTPV